MPSLGNVKDDADEAGEFTIIDTGVQNVNVTDVRWDKVKSGKNEGTDMVKLMYTIADGKYKGRTLWQNFPVNDKFMRGKIGQVGRASGLSDEILKNFDPGVLLNRSLCIKVKKKTYLDEEKNEVDLIFSKWKGDGVPSDVQAPPSIPNPDPSKRLPFESN